MALILLAAAVRGGPRLAYATFLPGDSAFDTVGIPVVPHLVADPSGNTFVASTKFTMYKGYTYDTFVMKIGPDGNAGFTTHIDVGVATGIALDPTGNIYVSGGRDQTHGSVAKLAPDGSVRYILPISAWPYAVAADSSGSAYITGVATVAYVTTPGTYKPDIGPANCTNPSTGTAVPCTDAFIEKVKADGSGAVYATFLGGTGDDSGAAIAVDPNGSVFVAGQTFSSDYPATPGAFQTTYGGSGDGFVARLDASGGSLVYATFAGGSDADLATGLALDSSQNIYITGNTSSADFPVTAEAFQTAYGGSGDVFFLKLTAEGRMAFASYLGGATADSSGGVAVGPANRFYVAVEDGTWRTQAAGAFLLALDQRPPTPCDPTVAIMAIDGTTGRVLDHYAFGAFGDSERMGNGALSVDGRGIVHITMEAWTSLFNPFLITPGGTPGGYGTSGFPTTYLARIDFSGLEQFAPYCMVNAATYDDEGVSVAPGEIVTIFGKGLGPVNGISAQPDPNGVYPRRLGNTKVAIGSTDLPLLYASDTQVNAVVPHDLGLTPEHEPTGTFLTVANGSSQAAYPVYWIFSSFQGIFRQGGYPSSQAVAINEDGSVNGPDRPAPIGSSLTFFLTGLGALTGPLQDDAITPSSPPWPGLAVPFQFWIEGTTSSGADGLGILYAGPAPGMAPGVYEIKTQVPDNAKPGNVGVRLMGPNCYTDQIPSCFNPSYVWIQKRIVRPSQRRPIRIR